MKHLIYVPFSGLGLHNGFRGNQWLENRIKVFRTFTLPSLLHQSNRDFTLWISWRPEEEGNPHVMELYNTLSMLRNFPFIFTYGGLCFEDDKYDRPVSTDRLQAALKISLPQLLPVLGQEQTILMTIQPSDDMYLSHAVQEIQDTATTLDVNKPQSIGYKEGFMMNYNTLELAEYAHHDWKTDETSTFTTNTIPPFFTVMFPRSIFLDPEAHMKWTGPYRSHEYISEHTDYHALSGPGFIVGTHGENISTTWHHRYKGRLIEGAERERILLQAGIDDVKPLQLEKDKARKIEQKWIDILPKPLKRIWMRYRTPGLGSAINDYNYFRL